MTVVLVARLKLSWLARGRCLDLDQDLDRVADQQPARFESGVPVQAEILAIDRGLGGEAGHFLTPRVLTTTVQGRVEDDFPGGATDREVADDLVVIATLRAFDSGALEG